MVKKHKFWVGVFLLLLLLSFAVLFLLPRAGSGAVARVSSEGKVIREVDLSLVPEPYEFTVETEKGYNVVRVEKGRLTVIDADCPDHLCQKITLTPGSAVPVICLPHELVIEIVGGESAVDAVAGGVS